MNWKIGDAGIALFAKSGARHALDPILVHRTRALAEAQVRVVLAVQDAPVPSLASAGARLLARERGNQKIMILTGAALPQWIPGRWLLTNEEIQRLWPNTTAPRNG